VPDLGDGGNGAGAAEALPAPITAAAADRGAENAVEASEGEHEAEAAPPVGPGAAGAEEEVGAAMPALAASAAVAESVGAIARPRYPPSPGPGVPRERAEDRPPPSVDPGEAPDSRRDLPNPSEFRYLKDEPRRGGIRGRVLAGVALVIAAAAAVIVLTTGGSSGSTHSPSVVATHSAHARHAPAPSHSGSAGAATGAAQVHVEVLNSTEINGLAHRLATTLQEHGFQQAQAQAGRPAGSYSGSVVEYAPGYSGQAENVARALGIETGSVRPMESGTQSLTPGASVVVIAAGSEASAGSSG
jgi:hypothetical protein